MIVEQFAEIPIGLGARSTRRQPLFQARLADFAHGGQIRVFLILEIVDVLAADQSVADEANLYAVVGAQHALVRCSRDRSQKYAARRVHWLNSSKIESPNSTP